MKEEKIDFKEIERKINEPEEENPKKWTDFYDLIKTFKNNNSGWNQAVIGRDKDSGKIIVRLRKARQTFTIKSEKHLRIIQDLLNKAAEELGWISSLSNEEITKIIDEKESLKEAKEKSTKRIKSYKKKVDLLLAQIGKIREEQFSINLNEFKEDLKEFRKLLDKDSKEKDIQLWIYNHLWVFGPNYIEGSKEDINRSGNRIDFLLQRYDTFYDVIELKLPDCKLFVGTGDKKLSYQEISRKYTMSSDLKDATSQIIGYLEKYELDKTNINWETNKSIHKPRGIIVLGRSDKKDLRALKTLNSYFHNIEIWTYDDIIRIANNFIEIIEKRKKKTGL
jgi:hypothetical protein